MANGSFINDAAKISEQLSRFTAYIHSKDGHTGFISFRDSTGFLGREEDYKSRVAEEARKELRFKEWKESWIGTGKIASCAAKAISKSSNLVNSNQQIDFKNRLNPTHPKFCSNAERVLFDIYCNSVCEESVAFSNAIKAFGAKYDTIAFLFFIKDDTRFLPISTGHFDTGFKLLNINYTTSFHCSWDNYQGFIRIIQEIRSFMEDMLPLQGTPRLIDAHSFVWVVQQNEFRNWAPDAEEQNKIEEYAESHIHSVIAGSGGQKKITSSIYVRSAEVVKETRKRANGICQLCKQPAPFDDKNGNPYLEVHHIVWLSRGGEDSTNNTVALCPNCHTRMHILDLAEDIAILHETIQ